MNHILKKSLIAVSSIFGFWLVASMLLASQASSLVFNNQVSWSPIPNYGYKQEFFRLNGNANNIAVWSFVAKQPTDEYVIYLHGNAGKIQSFFPELTKKANVIAPSYPGYHESEGSPSVDNVYATALATFDWMTTTKNIPANKITILGHSMGGSPATYLASQRPAKKLILVNTFSSVQSMCFASYSIFCAFTGGVFNTAKNAVNISIPVRQFAYVGDKTVPFEEGKKLYEYFKPSSDKQFIELYGQTHSTVNFEAILKEI